MSGYEGKNNKLTGLSIELLFKEYYSRLCHFAWQMLSDKERVEDVVQDAFMAYLDHADRVAKDDIAIKNFLYTSVRNACYNISRHTKVMQRYLLLQDINEVEESQVLAKIIRAEVMHEVYKIMQSMPEGCRQIFRMGYLEGLSNPQIADQLGVSVNTVKTQKQRGLKIIKGKLNPELLVILMLLLVEK